MKAEVLARKKRARTAKSTESGFLMTKTLTREALPISGKGKKQGLFGMKIF